MSDIITQAISSWNKACLPDIQTELDQNLLKIKEWEDKSLQSRQVIATSTKQLNKKYKNVTTSSNEIANATIISEYKTLIKKYQHEVDDLTNRANTSERVIVKLYEKFGEVPNPEPLLLQLLHKNDNNDTINDLKKKILDNEQTYKKKILELEANQAKILAKKVVAKESELHSIWLEKESNWKSREKELNNTIEKLKQLQKEEEEAAKKNTTKGEESNEVPSINSGDFELVVGELESCQRRIIDLEKRNETLSGEVSKLSNSSEKDSEVHEKMFEIKQLESEVSILVTKLDQSQDENSDKANGLSMLQTQIAALNNEVSVLKRKLNNYSDYDKIKQELNSLKKIEFGFDEEDEENDGTSKADSTVEMGLVQVNKKLQNKLAELRGNVADMEQDKKEFQLQIGALQSQISDLKSQNETLEEDLEKLDEVSSKFTDTQSIISAMTTTHRSFKTGTSFANHQRNTGQLSPTSSIVAGVDPTTSNINSINAHDSSTSGVANNPIMKIVTQQRDRFRSKNVQLEKQIKKLQSEQDGLTRKLEKLSDDNKKLYEKIKYLSSYQRGEFEVHDVEEQKYENIYNESLHPMQNFRQREISRYHNYKMNPLDKLFSTLAKYILANKTSRFCFLFYCLGLHALLMIMFTYGINVQATGYASDSGMVQTSATNLISNNNGGAGAGSIGKF
ncbi:CCAAT displacement transcription factor COY1 SCDLUD_003952 [Saccharomycodes ludwigii]|uniref:CCAAT displacement transcription factor COY1 n=1 Tax=Saccharomycodes ludwigii TaxID=36035 RepID=UPI001E8A87CB|nr:hypothetical protein SCDLUD_003952 [Saccharomycodes ludwigii]KAH3899669.1 hypothetical protein SCDLUD_003952 [Saccharomycodes ludwigii]